ncbi:hypothetical protein [Nostoc sp.]|uniref:hypothetical protein n=1 Tax=Nostoc sp. TaxID=1180 RepID=UPI002FF99213
MSLYNMSVMGIMPFGNLFIGELASITDAKTALIFGALCCVTSSIMFYKQLPKIERLLSQIYIKQKIILE